MPSCIYFKIKSTKTYESIMFDGPAISLLEAKSVIMSRKNLTQNSEFDLRLTDVQTRQGKMHFYFLIFLYGNSNSMKKNNVSNMSVIMY